MKWLLLSTVTLSMWLLGAAFWLAENYYVIVRVVLFIAVVLLVFLAGYYAALLTMELEALK